MAFSLVWLPEVLTRAGLKVARVPGWENRGRAEMGRVFGVMCHHTVGRSTGNMPSLDNLINGDSGLRGPKAQLGLARDGTFYVIAAGRANHAGGGSFGGIVNGNSNFIGIEGENTGLATDFPWPEVQMDAFRRGVAAILSHVRRPPEFCIGHKEWTRRKIDPLFDMNDFRGAVADFISGATPTPALIPPVERPGDPANPGRPTLRRGVSGALTRELQTILGVTADGVFGAGTEAAVRAFQRRQGLVPDGIVGPRTWAALDAS